MHVLYCVQYGANIELSESPVPCSFSPKTKRTFLTLPSTPWRMVKYQNRLALGS